jgi:hypothetical protein
MDETLPRFREYPHPITTPGPKPHPDDLDAIVARAVDAPTPAAYALARAMLARASTLLAFVGPIADEVEEMDVCASLTAGLRRVLSPGLTVEETSNVRASVVRSVVRARLLADLDAARAARVSTSLAA